MSAPYERVQYVDYHSAAPLNDGGPIQFVIPPTSNQFIDLRRTLLHVEAKIVRKDGKALVVADDKFGPVNLTLHSLFSQVDVELQQQLVSSNQHYGYKAYLETILGFDKAANDTYLNTQVFTKDDSLKVDEYQDMALNVGLFARHALFGQGDVVDMEGPLMADICQQERLMLNGVEIGIKLWPARDEFVIISAKKDYKVVLKEVYLKVCKVTPASSLVYGITEMLKEKAALYPFTRTEMRAYQLQATQLDLHVEDLFQQHVPSEVIVCMVRAKGFHGDYTQNPYSFNPFDIVELGLYVDDESIPHKPLKLILDGNSKNYVEAYGMLFDNPPTAGSTSITRDDFNKGFTIFRFRVSPQDVATLPDTRGNVKLHGRFSKALTENVTVLVVGKFHQVLTIDEARRITQ